MSIVPAATAPDFSGPVREIPRLVDAPGTTLALMVLAAGGRYCAGVDLASGAIVRTWSPEPATRPPRPYDTVEVTLDSAAGLVPDPTEPEGLALAGAPEGLGRLSGRRAERLLRPLLHPTDQPLLGLHAPAVPFWLRRPDHPSIAVVDPQGPLTLVRDGRYLACLFGWRGMTVELPCLDRRLAAAMDRAGLATMAGERGARMVVALHPPIEGHCHKVVEAVLDRP
ncbi:MAG: hypothetical protein ACRDY0_04930 [Acidimicrobiales bacterium]